MITNVSIFVNYIKEGGGPMGYTYNLIQGLSKLKNDKLHVTFHEINIIHKLNKSSSFLCIISRCARKIKTIRKSIYLKSVINKSHICIFQGYQDEKLSSYARKLHKINVYMPHSPSIMADEQRMLYELKNTILSTKEYNVILNNEEKLIKNADYLIFPSVHSNSAYMEKWADLITTKKVHYLKSGTIIRNNINEKCIQINNANKFVIAFIGRYVTHKGFDIFCKAADFLSHNDRFYFICAGDGPLKNLIPQNVHNLGFVKNIGAIIQQCNLIIIANKITYYDLLPIECAAYGLPLIYSDNGGNIDQAKEFTDSLLFKTNSVDSLAETIEKAADMIMTNSDWGQINKTTYLHDFTETKFAQRWLDFINMIISEHMI